MRRTAEEANKKRAAQARREQAGFQKLSKPDESAVRDIRRLQVFAEKDPRLRTAKRPKLYSKNRAAAMRAHLQNCRKRRKRLGPARYRGEDAVYVLLANILEKERRMQAYMGKKKLPVMAPKDLQKHKTQPTATSARRSSSMT